MKTPPKNIIIIRFSAMGDVVLMLPVIKNLIQQYPDTKISLLTRSFFHPFFKEIDQVTCYPVDLKQKHKGVIGLYKLVKELTRQNKYDAVFDLHAVLRSRIISFFFKMKHIPVYRLDKGRNEKRNFVNKKIRTVLKHTTDRYRNVFKQAEFNWSKKKQFLSIDHKKAQNVLEKLKTTVPVIGIAPFAAHKSKQWGIDKVKSLIEIINKKHVVRFYLFGGGKDEVTILEQLANSYENVENMAGKYSLEEEMAILQKLKGLIAMDSGNMHIATLLGVPVISIWGGTHPNLGFKALYQPDDNSIQIDTESLPCRPCSVYGTNHCTLRENPFACMTLIKPETVINRMEDLHFFKDN